MMATDLKLKPPIILIGNHRSGTTLTQQLFGLHPAVVTWHEPKTIWRYADPGRPDDEADESDATDEVVRYIRHRFLKYQLRNGNRQIMEKTPSNVLRVPFVHKVFPEAKFLYVTRNALSCINSAEVKWNKKKTKTWAALRKSLSDAPLSQLHYYARPFLSLVLVRKFLKNDDMLVTGPRYNGMDRDLKERGSLPTIARQWARCNRKAREDLAKLGDGRVLTFKYEDLTRDPASVLRRMYEHCGLSCDDSILNAARQVIDPGRQEKWRSLDQEQLRAIIPEIRDEMERYGYEIPQALR
jgi:sulfotransferase family protein